MRCCLLSMCVAEDAGARGKGEWWRTILSPCARDRKGVWAERHRPARPVAENALDLNGRARPLYGRATPLHEAWPETERLLWSRGTTALVALHHRSDRLERELLSRATTIRIAWPADGVRPQPLRSRFLYRMLSRGTAAVIRW